MSAPEHILNKVAKLVQKAEDFRRHGEHGSADAALNLADEMMVKYAIDAALLEQLKPKGEKERPAQATVAYPINHEFDLDLSYMLAAIAEHCRCKAVIRAYRAEATIIGFPTDIEYARLLWTSTYLAFVSKLDPSWDAIQTPEENIKILKESGRKWPEIARQANAHGFECTATDGRLKAAYRRQCKLEGVEPTSHTQRHAAYRAAYAEGFQRTIRYRLRTQRQAAAQQEAGTPGSALALRDRSADVLEAYYAMFPHLRPMSDEDRAKFAAEQKAQEEAEEAELAKMTPAQRAAHDRKQKRERERKHAEWERENARKQDAAGRAAGSAAAQTVDLGATKLTNTKKEIDS